MKNTLLLLLTMVIFSCSNDEQGMAAFENVKKGDSLFVAKTFGLDFYKKVRKPYKYYGATDPKAPKDTIDFERINSIKAEYFFKNRNSFIGIAKGTDATVSNPASVDNDKWIIVDADQNLIDFYLEDHPKWNDGSLTPYGSEDIGDHYLYVRAEDVSLTSTDEKLK